MTARRGEPLQKQVGAGDQQPYSLAKSTIPRFQRAVSRSGIVFDEAQEAAIARLMIPPAHGFYLWGGVGRGKTMLADMYYEAVPTARKRRFHFHNFFRDLQAEIFRTRQPVEVSIRRIIGPAQAVFFDEFYVHDVADAVYLTKMLESLLELDVLVLATSNYEPSELMPDPLFHDRFLPAIALIESRLEVVPVESGADYRRTQTNQARDGFGSGRWQVSPTALVDEPPGRVDLTVNGLTIQAVSVARTAAQFTFAELCERPFGTNEYLRLAEDFESIRLVAVPDLATASLDSLMRLCNLVDVLYHRNQRLDVESIAEPERMREAPETPLDATRTLSRLASMSLVSSCEMSAP